MAEEFGRHGTLRSNVGCDAMEDPWTNRIGAFAPAGSTAHLFHRNSFTSPLLVQCSAPASRWVVSFMDRSFLAWLRYRDRTKGRPIEMGSTALYTSAIAMEMHSFYRTRPASFLPKAARERALPPPFPSPQAGEGRVGAADQSPLI